MRSLMRVLLALCTAAPFHQALATPPLLTVMGTNSYDLAEQYLGTGSSGDSSTSRAYVGTTMSRHGLKDARDVGFRFVRVAVAGYNPIAPFMTNWSWFNDLYLWQRDRDEFWRRMDRMMDDLDSVGLQIVPVFLWNMDQFAALTNTSVSSMLKPSSSRVLFESYVNQFIMRYKDRSTILFYEAGNELNLNTDLAQGIRCSRSDSPQNCSPWDNVPTNSLLQFAARLSGLIHRLDPARMVSSGYATPRENAYHLWQQSEFSPQGPDWTADTHDQFVQVVKALHEPFELVSAHVYPGDRRFSDDDTAIVSDLANVASSIGRKLFIGEYGDIANTTFLSNMLTRFATSHVDYASVWTWMYFPGSPYEKAGGINLVPGYNDDTIALLYAAMHPGTSRPAKPPRVTLTWPAPCSPIKAGTPTTLFALATGYPSVTTVRFLVDGVEVGSTTSLPHRSQYTFRSAGVHHVQVVAQSPSGQAVSEYDVGGSSVTCAIPAL